MEAYALKKLREREQQAVIDAVRSEVKALHRRIETSRKDLSAKIDTSNHIKELLLEPVAKVVLDVETLRKQGDAMERTLGALRSDDFLIEKGTALAAKLHIAVFETENQVQAAIAYAQLASASTVVERRSASFWQHLDRRVKVLAAIVGTLLLVTPAVLSVADHLSPRPVPPPVVSPRP